MNSKLFTLEKGPFLAISTFSFSAVIKYFEDLRRALPKSDDFQHAFSLFVIFLVIGTISIGVYIGLIIAEKNISRNIDKNKKPRK